MTEKIYTKNLPENFYSEDVAAMKEYEKQQFFLKKLKKIISDLEDKKGRKLTCNVTTFGCPTV